MERECVSDALRIAIRLTREDNLQLVWDVRVGIIRIAPTRSERLTRQRAGESQTFASLSGQSDGDTERVGDTLSFHSCGVSRPLPSPGLPPEAPLPTPAPSVPQLAVSVVPALCSARVLSMTRRTMPTLTGPTRQTMTRRSRSTSRASSRGLNESGASDRRSFVEQLEGAFRTPAKFDLKQIRQVQPRGPVAPASAVDILEESFVANDISLILEDPSKYEPAEDGDVMHGDLLSSPNIVGVRGESLIMETNKVNVKVDNGIETF